MLPLQPPQSWETSRVASTARKAVSCWWRLQGPRSHSRWMRGRGASGPPSFRQASPFLQLQGTRAEGGSGPRATFARRRLTWPSLAWACLDPSGRGAAHVPRPLAWPTWLWGVHQGLGLWVHPATTLPSCLVDWPSVQDILLPLQPPSRPHSRSCRRSSTSGDQGGCNLPFPEENIDLETEILCCHYMGASEGGGEI